MLGSGRDAVQGSTSAEAGFRLKWLLDKLDNFDEMYKGLAADSDAARQLADVLSVLFSTQEDDGSHKCLHYRLVGSGGALEEWGYEYTRCLASQLVLAHRDAAGGEKEGVDAAPEPAAALPEGCASLVDALCRLHVKSGREADCVDLLIETGGLAQLPSFLDGKSYARACLYLLRCAKYLTPPEDRLALGMTMEAYLKGGSPSEALVVALLMGGAPADVLRCIEAADSDAERRQLALILGREGHRSEEVFERLEELDREAEDAGRPMADGASLTDCAGNTRLNEFYKILGRDLDVLEAREPDDVFRSGSSSRLDSARGMLASSVVNGWLNAGFGQDKHLTSSPEGDDEAEEAGKTASASGSWIFKNKEHGKISAVAALGLVMLWDIDGGLPQVDRYLYSSDPQVLAGALLAVGVLSSGVRNECDPAIALLEGHLSSTSNSVASCAALGLGVAYAGHPSAGAKEALIARLNESGLSTEDLCLTAVALGLVCMGTGDEEAVQTLTQALMCPGEAVEHSPLAPLLALSLGLLFLGRRDEGGAVAELAKAFPPRLAGMCGVLIQACAHAGTGNVLAVQELLALCVDFPGGAKEDGSAEEGGQGGGEQAGPKKGGDAAAAGAGGGEGGAPAPEGGGEVDKASAAGTEDAGTGAAPMDTSGGEAGEVKPSAGAGGASEGEDAGAKLAAEDAKETAENTRQTCAYLAVVGIATVACGEGVGTEMARRTLDHLLQYGGPGVRKAVPFALALLCPSDPDMAVLDMLSRLSHDASVHVAMNAIIGMGLTGAGTNNARIATILRQLAQYYAKDQAMLFAVRLAQGLLHMGKGLLTLNPYSAHQTLSSQRSLGSLLALAMLGLDPKGLLAGRFTHLIYLLVPALRPRMFIAVDEALQPVAVQCRVGQGLDTAGQVGQPRTITGFQTHTTPVLLSAGDRAEIATETHESLCPVLEGVCIVRKKADEGMSAAGGSS